MTRPSAVAREIGEALDPRATIIRCVGPFTITHRDPIGMPTVHHYRFWWHTRWLKFLDSLPVIWLGGVEGMDAPIVTDQGVIWSEGHAFVGYEYAFSDSVRGHAVYAKPPLHWLLRMLNAWRQWKAKRVAHAMAGDVADFL